MLEFFQGVLQTWSALIAWKLLGKMLENARIKTLLTPNTGYWVFIDEVLTIIDQETYNTGVFIDYLLVKISIFLVKTIDLYRLIMYNEYIKLRR